MANYKVAKIAELAKVTVSSDEHDTFFSQIDTLLEWEEGLSKFENYSYCSDTDAPIKCKWASKLFTFRNDTESDIADVTTNSCCYHGYFIAPKIINEGDN